MIVRAVTPWFDVVDSPIAVRFELRMAASMSAR